MESALDRPPVHNMYYTEADKTKSSKILKVKDSYYTVISTHSGHFTTILGVGKIELE
jgi:hypothetical protein